MKKFIKNTANSIRTKAIRLASQNGTASVRPRSRAGLKEISPAPAMTIPERS